MAVAFDAYSSGGGSNSWTHTPTGTPRAVRVSVNAGSDPVTAVTYGGVAMTQIGSSLSKGTGESVSHISAWFLGSSIPTGAQTVAMTSDSSAFGHAVTATGNDDTEVVDFDTISSDSQANPSVVLSAGGREVFADIVFRSGQDAVDDVTPFTDWTARDETDIGTQVAGYYTYDTVGTSDVTAGWTQTADDATAIAVAIAEVAAGGVAIPVFRHHYMVQKR